MQGGSNHSAVSSNSHLLTNCHLYCMPIIELMKNFPQYFFFLLQKADWIKAKMLYGNFLRSY